MKVLCSARRMLRRQVWWATSASASLLYLCSAVVEAHGQSELPKSVQADLYRNQIYEAAAADDCKTVLSTITQYRKLGSLFPQPMLFLEAKAARKCQDPRRAYTALSDFLKGADKNSDWYKDAVTLYSRYKTESENRPIQTLDLSQASDRELSGMMIESNDCQLKCTTPPPGSPCFACAVDRSFQKTAHLDGCVLQVTTFWTRGDRFIWHDRGWFDFRGGLKDVRVKASPIEDSVRPNFFFRAQPQFENYRVARHDGKPSEFGFGIASTESWATDQTWGMESRIAVRVISAAKELSRRCEGVE